MRDKEIRRKENMYHISVGITLNTIDFCFCVQATMAPNRSI